MNGARMMMIKRLSLFGLLFALGMNSVGASALDPCEESEKVDAELNRVYKQILRKYKDQPLFLKKLKLAQRAWIKGTEEGDLCKGSVKYEHELR